MFIGNTAQPTSDLEASSIRENSNKAAKPDASTCFVLVMTLLFTYIIISARKEKRKIKASQLAEHIPCQNCQFFHESRYLKCAVQPKVVLTQQAIECPDYHPHQ